MTMTLEEARKRVQICNGHIEPKQINERQWACDNCGVGLVPEHRNSSGYRHYYNSGNEKTCNICLENKHITDFYYRRGALDDRYGYCKSCARDSTANREKKLQLKGKTRHIWLPNDLWSAVHRVRGRQTFRDFVVVAVRKEVEVRARTLMMQQAVDGIKNKKPKAKT